MTRYEKLADTISRHRDPDHQEKHREFVRQVADDLELEGAARQRFLYAAGHDAQ